MKNFKILNIDDLVIFNNGGEKFVEFMQMIAIENEDPDQKIDSENSAEIYLSSYCSNLTYTTNEV